MGTLKNSEDPDEMPRDAAFHLGLRCLLRQNLSSEKETFFLEIITCDPAIYAMDHPDLTVSNCMGNSIGTKRVKHKLSSSQSNLHLNGYSNQDMYYLLFHQYIWTPM